MSIEHLVIGHDIDALQQIRFPRPLSDPRCCTVSLSGVVMGGQPAATDWMRQVRATQVSAVLQAERGYRSPPCPENTVRGALGLALFEDLCVRPDRDCGKCAVARGCLLPGWFDPGRLGSPQIRPFTIRVESTGDLLVVQVLLLGEIPRPDRLLSALARALTRLGAARVPHEIVRMRVTGEQTVSVIELGQVVADWPAPGTLRALVREVPEQPTLLFETPLRLDRGRQRPDAGALLDGAVRRVRDVTRAQGVRIERYWEGLDAFEGRWQRARWVERSRFSERQGQRVDLSGWVGAMSLRGPVAQIADLLAAVEVLHLGRASSAGLGRVRLIAA